MALTYKVFPGTPYYSNTSLTTKAGEIVNTTAAGYINTTYGTVSVGGSTYYVAYGQMVSFYNSMYTGDEIDNAVTKVGTASATPASGGTKLFTTGGAYTLQTAIANKADKTDLSSINQTGSTCTETNGIAAGVYFYLDGDLVVAKTAIAYGATFTQGTNYEPPTAGALNALKSALTVYAVGQYKYDPNGSLVIQLRERKDNTSLMGILVLTHYESSPIKTGVFYVLVASGYTSRLSTIVSNGLSPSISYNSTANTLTVSFSSSLRFVQADLYYTDT